MVKPLMLKYKTITVVKWIFVFGMIYVIPFGWDELYAFNPGAVSTVAWVCIFYVIIASTYLAYFLNTYALAELSPSIASTYIYMQPVIAAGIAVGLKKDTIDAAKVFAAILIGAGIYLVGRSRRKERGENKAIEQQKANG
jgi:drug/metabolite transporter (DMT)-like permease